MSAIVIEMLIWFGYLWVGCGFVITVAGLIALAIPHRLAEARLGYPPPPPPRRAGDLDRYGPANDNVIPLRRRNAWPRPL